MRQIRPSSKTLRTVLCAALGAALLALLCTGAAGARPELFTEQTEHYSIETDVSPEFAHLVGAHMEEIFKEYSRRFGNYGQMKLRFRVAVFDDEEEYWRVAPPQVKGSTGVFVAYDQLLAAHRHGRTTEEVLRTLYHEGFHQFMYSLVSQKCPIWLNEGLAEYFSEATWNGDGFTTGQVPTLRLHTVQSAIARGNYIPLAELFSMGSGRWLQNVSTDSHRADLHYSQAWSVAQFVIHAEGGRYAGMLDRFLKELSEREDEAEAFRVSFGTDVQAFERAWAQYVMSLRPSPKFRCRDNMEALMLLASLVYEDPREFNSVSDLRDRLVHNPRYGWQITRATGETLTWNQAEEVAKLFRCPYHEETGISYVVVRDTATQMPMLVCNHHPGVIMKAYYRPRESGALAVTVEEQVRDTVPDDLRQAIMDASD